MLAGLTGLLWGGLVRIFLFHHATWSVNSICHCYGTRPFVTSDESRNNWVIAIVALGEGWHHNHHAFPTSARHGLLRGQWDPSYGLICCLERLGLARDVRRPTLRELTANARGHVFNPLAIASAVSPRRPPPMLLNQLVRTRLSVAWNGSVRQV